MDEEGFAPEDPNLKKLEDFYERQRLSALMGKQVQAGANGTFSMQVAVAKPTVKGPSRNWAEAAELGVAGGDADKASRKKDKKNKKLKKKKEKKEKKKAKKAKKDKKKRKKKDKKKRKHDSSDSDSSDSDSSDSDSSESDSDNAGPRPAKHAKVAAPTAYELRAQKEMQIEKWEEQAAAMLTEGPCRCIPGVALSSPLPHQMLCRAVKTEGVGWTKHGAIPIIHLMRHKVQCETHHPPPSNH
jgi:hypothetical protein